MRNESRAAPGEASDWRSLDRATLDRAYNNREAVPGSGEIVAGWQVRSAATRRERLGVLDLEYGPRPRNRIDFFGAGAGAPTLVFFHGGYWQSREKETFTFIAEGPLAIGVSVALVGYTLAPEATLDEIVAEAHSALDFLGSDMKSLGGDPNALWLGGWSAGAHIAAMSLTHPLVRGGLAISGIYDLEPIAHSYINDKLRLDADAARRNSPLLNLPQSALPLVIAVGGAELPMLCRQSADFAAARSARDLPGSFMELEGCHHFSILEQLNAPDGALTLALSDLVEGRTAVNHNGPGEHVS